MREWCVVIGADIELVKVLEEERPLRGVQLGWRLLRGFHSEALLLLQKCSSEINNRAIEYGRRNMAFDSRVTIS